MTLTEALLDTWDRQARIVESVASLVNEDNKNAKPSVDGWPLFEQLAHIHQVRRYWLSQVDEERASKIESSYLGGWHSPIDDLDKIKRLLHDSAEAVREVVASRISGEIVQAGPYDNPVLFLQHMVWHDGWHVGLIFLGLRLAGQEPQEMWEESHVWGEWRTEEPWTGE